jgi:hypothetical protein
MKLPAVAIVTAFASGIALGFWPVIAKYATAPGFLRATAIAAALFIIIDSSFQLSFLAMFCIAALAVPWLANSVELYARGLRGWRDVTRDVSHPPRIAQFRIDLRSVAAWVEGKLPARIVNRTTQLAARALGLVFRVWEMIVLTVVLQIGMRLRRFGCY